jgi:hypothetical protein
METTRVRFPRARVFLFNRTDTWHITAIAWRWPDRPNFGAIPPKLSVKKSGGIIDLFF